MNNRILTDRSEALRAGYGTVTSGRFFTVVSTGTPLFLPILRYDGRVDLVAMKFYSDGDPAGNGLPTVNELIEQGVLAEATISREADVVLEEYPSCRHADSLPPFTGEMVRRVIDEFSKKGFKVSREAVMHNFKAWFEDYKSGYRDEKNGYHLFTPCGCNMLQFSATSLEEGLDDWQVTYEG